MPVFNESGVIAAKLANLEQLDYPRDRLKILIVSDGSTDGTLEVIRQYPTSLNIQIVEVNERRGKANALNTGLQQVDTELVVFSDASILLEADSLRHIVRPFQDASVGCVSGEDHIANGGGEGLYGQYELFLRNQESAIGSIVGASGSFYAQRLEICREFEEGLAPDFLSVLNTVAAGYRAITEPAARGHMKAVKSSGQEFQRKVRTLLRGMTALFDRAGMLNPFRYGLFSFFLISHKLLRWLVPLFLVTMLLSSAFLLDQLFYQLMFIAQLLFYGLAMLAGPLTSPLHNSIAGKIPLFFVMVNIAIVAAWVRYLRGDRQELWTPSQRSETG
jgi:cellulose synthase/poly-beta-1,6-N-acetylglucosamine synthase-like glycosyltransferase